MATFQGVILVYVAFLITTSLTDGSNKKNEKAQIYREPFDSKNMIGVSSVAGITSRNGRVSTLGGIKFFTPQDLIRRADTNKVFYPISLKKEVADHFVTGTIRFNPSSLTVMSSAKAGNTPDNFVKKMFIQPSPNVFGTPRRIEPWFTKDIFDNLSSIKPLPMLPFNPFVVFWR